MHNYLRMLWGKKILEWTSVAARGARDVMIELNNSYALDGRDPNSYSGIFWVLGRYDRPWGPERPVFGTVRYMSSENTVRKLRMKHYLAQLGATRPATLRCRGWRGPEAVPTLAYRCSVDVPPRELFAWHARPGAFERLVPPGDDVRVLSRRGTIRDGDELRMQLRHGPLRLVWLARHEQFVEGRQFIDVQVRRRFVAGATSTSACPAERGGSVLHDAIDYALPAVRATIPVDRRRPGATAAGPHVRVSPRPHRRRPRPSPCLPGAAAAERRRARRRQRPRARRPAFLATGGHAVHGLVRVGEAMAAVRPFEPGAAPSRIPALEALVVPDGSPSPLTQSQQAFDLLAHLPTLPATLVTVAELPAARLGAADGRQGHRLEARRAPGRRPSARRR